MLWNIEISQKVQNSWKAVQTVAKKNKATALWSVSCAILRLSETLYSEKLEFKRKKSIFADEKGEFYLFIYFQIRTLHIYLK